MYGSLSRDKQRATITDIAQAFCGSIWAAFLLSNNESEHFQHSGGHAHPCAAVTQKR